MKVTNIEIHPDFTPDVIPSVAFVDLSFKDPKGSNPYNVIDVTGLDADDIAASMYREFGLAKIYSLALPKREVAIQIGLNPNFANNQSYSDLRDNLYKIITSRTGQVQLHFKNGTTTTAGLFGVVSKFDSTHFERTQMVTIIIQCTEPLLKQLTRETVSVSGPPGTGTYPSQTIITDNKSTAPHGFKMQLHFAAAVPSLSLQDFNYNFYYFTAIPVGGFLTNDVLVFSSEVGDKTIYISRGANTIYLADVIQTGSTWPLLYPGDNGFAFTYANLMRWDSFSHIPTYWGI